MDVSKLIAELASQGVSSFEGYGIKVSFHPKTTSGFFQGSVAEQLKPIPQAPQEASETPIDPAMAQSMEGEMNYDKVLNWSASPDPGETDTPLTGDSAPLTSEG